MAGLKSAPVILEHDALIDKRSGKPRRISAKLRQVIRLLIDGECRTIKAAGARVGLAPEYLSRALRQPHVQRYLDERTRAALDQGKMAATARLLELLNAKSEHVSFDAARHTLAIANLRPPDQCPSVQINNNVMPGYIIKLKGIDTNRPLPTIEQEGLVSDLHVLPARHEEIDD